MPPETAEAGSPEDRHQLRAGTLLRAAVDGLGLSHKSFAEKAGVESGTLRRLWTEGAVAPVLDATKAGLLKAFREECEVLEAVPGIVELAEETNRRVIDTLLAGRHGIADWLMLKWWLQTGKRPMDDSRRSLLRTGGANVPEFSELLAIAREVGLLDEEGQTEEDEPRSPWDNQAVQDAARAWLYEAVERAGRSPGLARFVMALQLAGLQTTADGLQRLGAQCRERDIAVPADETVDLTSVDASLVVNHKVPPFTAVCNILQVVGAHTGRPGLVGEVQAMWSHVEVSAETSFGVLETHFTSSGFTFRELAHVVGVPYASGAQENNPIYRMLRGKHDDAPFRAMALALAPNAAALRSIEERRLAEILQWHRLRGKERRLPQAAVMRELWPFKAEDLGLDRGGFDGLLYDRGGALRDEDVLARMEQVGLERVRDMLVRWLQRRGFYSARQVMLAVCERHKLGDSGNGVAKLEKDVGYGDFRRFYDDEKLLLPTRLLREMLQTMLGMDSIPPGLETRHRLDYGDFLAGDAGGALTSRQRFFEAVITDGYRSQRHYHTTLGHDDSVRQSFQRMFAKLGKGNVDSQILSRHTSTLLGTAGVLQARLHRIFAALTATGGSYPDAVAAVCREWMEGDDDDRMVAGELLAVLRTPSVRELAPHPLQETVPTSAGLARLLDARWRTGRERNGSAWDEKEAPEFLVERRGARTLRLLPGITQNELAAAAHLLRFEVASAAVDEIMDHAPRPHTDETMARLAGFIAPLIDGDQTEAGVLHRVQVSSSLFGQWRDAAVRFAPPLPKPETEVLAEVLPRSVPADLLEIKRSAGATGVEAVPDDEAEAMLIGRWGAPELRLAVLVRRLALVGAMTTQPADAGAVTVAKSSSKPSEQQRLLMVQIIELLFAQHGDNDQLDRLCVANNVNSNVLTTWRAMRKREETKRRAREQGTELDRLRAEVQELRALTGAPLQDAERDELVRLRGRVAELEATEGTGIDTEERGELERLRLRVQELEDRPDRAEYDRVIRKLEAFAGYVPPVTHAEVAGRAADLQRQLEAMADHVPPGIHAAAVQRAEELLVELGELRARTPVQPEQSGTGELQAELERLRDQLRSRPTERVVQRVVQSSALPRELHGAFVKGVEITSVGADPVTALLDILTAPTINAQAFLQLYRRVMDAIGASAEIGGPMHDDMIYVQQYAAGVISGRRDSIFGVIERLIARLRPHRPSWQPRVTADGDGTIMDTRTVVVPMPVEDADSGALLRRAQEAERQRDAAVRERDRVAGLHDSLLQAHERLQADAALQVRAALEERDAAQGEQRRLKTISDRQARELREATEREHGLLAELERLRAGSQATVLGDDADVEGEAVDPHTLPEYEVHPDDDSGVDFGAYEHVARIGEYLANFLDVGSAGFGLDEPASHSIARRIASLPRLETNDVAAAMHVVACCYSIDPAHPGNGLIIGRLRRYLEVDEPLGDETNAACFQDAVEEMLADEEAEAAVRRLREATPDHPLLALINQPLPERLVTAVPPPPPPNDGPDEDRDPPPGEPPRKKKIRKKKKSRRREDDEFDDMVPGLRELIGDAADEEYQPSPEDIAEAERLVDE